MSRPISESVSLLTETLGNCKTALTEKQVADVDNIKISDVDEKIAEIKAGGGDTDNFDKPKSFNLEPTTMEASSTTFTVSTTKEQIEKYYPGQSTLDIYCCFSGDYYEVDSRKNNREELYLTESNNYQKSVTVTTSSSTDNLADMDSKIYFVVALESGDGYKTYGEAFAPKIQWTYEG